jgi:DNA-binding LacI/PurR family transcriptional regulator
MKQRVSIKDIAAVAGVSAPTVSRALHRRGRVSAATRAQILAVARELGYTPSLVARGLVTQRSYTVGLVVTSFADPFHSEVAQGVEEAAAQHGYSLFLASSGADGVAADGATGEPDREVAVVRRLQGQQVDGVIVSASRVGDRYADLLQERGIPLVLVNTHVEGEQIHSIYHDDYQGGRLLLAHLLARGYRRIGYLGDQRGGRTNLARQQAWHDALHEAGLDATLTVSDPGGQLAGGVAATAAILQDAQRRWQRPPDALYCYNDVMAIGALAALHRAGLRVPEDVAVTGFDDIDVAAYTIPPLTTLHQPRRAIGTAALQTLLALINGEEPSNGAQATKMIGELMIRGSS